MDRNSTPDAKKVSRNSSGSRRWRYANAARARAESVGMATITRMENVNRDTPATPISQAPSSGVVTR